MKNLSFAFVFISGLLFFFSSGVSAQEQGNQKTSFAISMPGNTAMYFDFYADNIVRWHWDPTGSPMHGPVAQPPAQILADHPRRPVGNIRLTEDAHSVVIRSLRISITYTKASQLLRIDDLKAGKCVLETLAPVSATNDKTTLELKAGSQEYFFGGGVQNGRFSHKGHVIAIENQNSWTDGGVASPTPFYWSTNGYGLMWYTFRKGKYDFGSKVKGVVQLMHETSHLDVFLMVDADPASLLRDYYQLTGSPVLLPKFAFYEGHLNAYNRDFWKQDAKGVLFEDGTRYRESQKDNGGVKESLNGEKNNYQFSARAVIDRYQNHDMPLGWILPNDGYGAGYGQTSTLDSNIHNLKIFGDYARTHRVQIGLWTQSDLHPKAGVSALLQRDLEKEVGVAGVRVLKTDVAWVGPGYSFGLNGVADAANIIQKFGSDARPFIISLDGWAGTQRYAAVWTGDQTGGEWEYIRFHLPTYVGSGLSGQPNITSDMDGIFGGANPIVNTRDYQWKTFSLMQLNMDGWGLNPKYPFALGEPAASINRIYLKWKAALLPYTYSISHQALQGLPPIRATFLEDPNSFTYGKATEYQYMFGPWFLVAPVYQNTKADTSGNDIRNGIYLPKGKWLDYFSGQSYEGGKVINSVDAPVWKLPLFVKAGAIIPMNLPNNHVKDIQKGLRIYECYPYGNTSFVEYDDDGRTEQYKNGKYATTLLESSEKDGKLTITVHKTAGHFDGMVRQQATLFRINVSTKPTTIIARANKKTIRLKEVFSMADLEKSSNAFYYDAAPLFNNYATPGSDFEKKRIARMPQLLVKVGKQDITATRIALSCNGYRAAFRDAILRKEGVLSVPGNPWVADSLRQAFTLTPAWTPVAHADYYEVKFDSMVYSTIQDTFLLFGNLQPDTEYTFHIRAVNKTGASEWAVLKAITRPNPLQFAIRNIKGFTSVANQEGEDISNLFDFDESNLWHTAWDNNKAVPFDIVMDLGSFNTIDKLVYVPRGRGNGVLLKGEVFVAKDTSQWKFAGAFDWKYNGAHQTFRLPENQDVSWMKIHVTDAVRNFGSGKELYVFKVPGSESLLKGDINHDGKIDANDLTSYLNYAGLRMGDADFEGYVSKGDINGNGIIDAYDIAYALSQSVTAPEKKPVITQGSIRLVPNKPFYKKGETVEITVEGMQSKQATAFSFALPYSASDLTFSGIVPNAASFMENFSNNRLHSDGSQELFVAFVDSGSHPPLQGNADLLTIKFIARKDLKFQWTASGALFVGTAP